MSFVEDFFDFLYRNMHWILIGLVLILFWNIFSDNTFLILAIIAIIIGIMWDNWNKSQQMMTVEEGFPGSARGKSPNSVRGTITGGGYDALYGHTLTVDTCSNCPFTGDCPSCCFKSGGCAGHSTPWRLDKPCPKGCTCNAGFVVC